MYPLPPQVNTALTLLNRAGFEAFVVGGAVRDLLRGAPVHDWDITTSALPEQTKEVFSDYRLIETGIKHGTVTVLMDGLPLEITTYRTEGTYSDHRRPDNVEFTRSLEEDLARRDFTINAMAYHPETGVVDLFGGQNDLETRIIRCVGEPDKRFQEDALRMLRALRFASRLGFSIEEETAAAIHRNRMLLAHVAPERIREELTGLLCGSCVEPVLRQYHDVLSVPIPEIAPLVGFNQHLKSHCHDLWGHISAVTAAAPARSEYRWAGLFHDFGKPNCFFLTEDGKGRYHGHPEQSAELAARIMERLRFSNAERNQICFLVSNHHLFHDITEERIRWAIQQFGSEKLNQLKWMLRADILGKSPRCLHQLDELNHLYGTIGTMSAQMDQITPKDLAVTGSDLMALGLSGTQIGQALERLVNAVVFEGLENKKESLLAYLEKYL